MGYKWEQMAILVRARAQFAPIERALAMSGVPYTMVGNQSFFDAREVKDILSFLSWVMNPASIYDATRFGKNMLPGIGDKSFPVLYKDEDLTTVEHLQLYRKLLTKCKVSCHTSCKSVKDKCMGYMLDTAITIREKYSNSAVQALTYLYSYMDITAILAEQSKKEKKKVDRTESMEPLKQVAHGQTLTEFLDNVALISPADEEEDGGIILSTIHAAKGKEWPVVVIPNLYEGVLPHSMGMKSEDEIAQEYNAYYVAKTRAKEHLIMTRPLQGYKYGTPLRTKRSRFISANLDRLKKVGNIRLL